MDIVLFGIQGSGKGTLGKLISEQYGFKIFETGSALRNLSQQNSPLAQKVKSIIEAGHLVPNEVVMDIIEDFMQKLPPNTKVLFDGIPRKISQAESFDTLMQNLGRNFTGILIDVPEAAAIKRLSTRRICENCKTVYPSSYSQADCEKCGGQLITRSDDNPESIKTRLTAFFEETIPVIERYQQKQKMLTMNGNVDIDEAKDSIFKLIENLKK